MKRKRKRKGQRTTLLTLLSEGCHLLPWQMNLIQHFAHITHEEWLITLLAQTGFCLPVGTRMWFYYELKRRRKTSLPLPLGFLWVQQQGTEANGKILRVHALYVSPENSRWQSKLITRSFEHSVTDYAKLKGITEIGFYTKRNPQAFLRRLNATVPKETPWQLDSYVLTRPVK